LVRGEGKYNPACFLWLESHSWLLRVWSLGRVFSTPKILVSRLLILSIFFYISILFSNCVISIPFLQMPRKPTPKPLWLSQADIKNEQANMKKREQLRIYQLWEASEDSKGQVNVATQTELTFQSANDNAMPYRNVYLNFCCFCVLAICMNLLLLQWLYQYNLKH